MTDHPIPDAALEADIATVAQKGAGKTYANRGMVERLLDMGRRVIVLDPLNSWWGLKVKADGTAGYPVAVIGGPNGDIALDPTRGEALGEFLADSALSVVIDVSELRRGELMRFSTDFLRALYRTNRDALWLVLEEADVFAPQQPMNDATFLLHEVDQIARRGRARGFRLWTITQRPAKLHKDVLTQTSTLVLMRIRGPQDRKAAEEWVKGHTETETTAKTVIDSLASLEVGEGWVWAPDHRVLERVRFPAIKTLDTSSTPKAGEIRTEVKEIAKADIAHLIEALKPPEAGAGPDVRTSAEVAEMLKKARQEGYTAGEADGFKAGMLQGENQGLKKALSAAHGLLDAFRKQHPEQFSTEPAQAPPQPAQEYAVEPAEAGPQRVTVGMTSAGPALAERRPAVHIDAPAKTPKAVTDIIAFYRAVYPRAVPFLQAAKAAGVGMKSSQFRTYEPALIASGQVEALGDGRYRAHESVGTPAEYLDRVAGQLTPKQRAIFDFIRRTPHPVTRDEIVRAAEVSPTSSTTAAALSLLMHEAEVIERLDGDRYQLLEHFR